LFYCEGLIPCSKLRGRLFFLNQIMADQKQPPKANPAIREKATAGGVVTALLVYLK
jgi:hypothetical protein